MMTHMKVALLALLSTTALTGCMYGDKESTPASLPPGEYESTSSRTDANGTTTSTETNTDVTVDKYGNKTATVSKETTTDPKGLFNKNTTTSTKTYSESH